MNKQKKNWLEWSVFAAGLVLVAGTLGYLTYRAATRRDTPPVIEVRLGTPEKRLHDFIVPVTVVNHGSQTAEAVKVEVTLQVPDAPPERGEFEVQFLPDQATRKGWAVFKSDPRTAERMEARVVGYKAP